MLIKLCYKTIFFIFICFILNNNSFSQTQSIKPELNTEKKGKYSGGMLFLQGGGIIYNNQHQQIQDISYGFGGILRIYLYKYLCIGIYGGTQKTNYHTQLSKNSYLQIGYGGILVGGSIRKNNFRYSLSACMGGGSVKNLHIENQYKQTLLTSYLYKNPVFIVSPLLSVDYFISPKIALTLQGTCLFGINSQQNPLYNPCLQVGILFNH